jgi:hypothetical protein
MNKLEKGESNPLLRGLAGPSDPGRRGGILIKSRGNRAPPPLKKVCTKNCLPLLAQYVYVRCYLLLL